jgi:sensor histidine kinase regulating citrate/malate metabolism
VLDSGTETALQHGSGLGLWLVKWGTEIVGGSVSFDRNEPTGTVVTATVPWGDRDDPRVHAGEPATDRSTISR